MTPGEALIHCVAFEEAWSPGGHDVSGGLRGRVLAKWILGTDHGRMLTDRLDPDVEIVLKEIALVAWIEARRAPLEGETS